MNAGTDSEAADTAMLEVIAVPTTAQTDAQAIRPSRIGLGQPLSIRIKSIFPGTEHHEAVLITSAARSPVASKAAPVAMHYYVPRFAPGQPIRPLPEEPGSDVIFYSPGLTENTLRVSVRMSFDDFDQALYQNWLSAAQKAAALPVFALGPHAAAAGALVYGVSQTVKIILRAVDRRIDGENDWVSTWSLPVHEAGQVPARPGYWLFYGDDQSGVPLVQGPDSPLFTAEFKPRELAYVVSTEDATLRYADQPEREVLEGEPYVLAFVNGSASTELAAWTRTSVSAALAQRFLETDGDDASDVVELLEVYNDVIMTRNVQDIDQQLAGGDLSGEEETELKGKRKGWLKNILDEDLRKQLTAT